jgi:hypothetical protein
VTPRPFCFADLLHRRPQSVFDAMIMDTYIKIINYKKDPIRDFKYVIESGISD